MIAKNAKPITLTYRMFTISFEKQESMTMLKWESIGHDYIGTQQVTSAEWSNGELLKFAMDCIDNIWKQWNRIEYERTHDGREQPE